MKRSHIKSLFLVRAHLDISCVDRNRQSLRSEFRVHFIQIRAHLRTDETEQCHQKSLGGSVANSSSDTTPGSEEDVSAMTKLFEERLCKWGKLQTSDVESA